MRWIAREETPRLEAFLYTGMANDFPEDRSERTMS